MVSTEASSCKKYNMWKECIKFFNTKVGQEVTRKEHLREVKHKVNVRGYMMSIDQYRGLLLNSKFLKRTGRGRYLVVKQIPDIPITVLREFIEQDKPMSWFKFWGGLDHYLEYRRENGKG